VQFDVLGPLRVRATGEDEVVVSGRRLRRLLGRLVVDAGRPVRLGELVDAVWTGEDPPDANALQALVSRLRRSLGDGATIVQTVSGYQLDGADTDVRRFESAISEGDAESALGLWRGEPLIDADGADYTVPLVARLAEQHLLATERHLAARLGAPGTAAQLEELVRLHPLRETLVALLIRSLADSDRTADALAAYERTRTLLADELGVDPGTELQQLQLELLRGKPTRVRRTNLRAARTRFVGRDDEVKRLVRNLDNGRLATIVGPGGAGKTRLANEVAADFVARMPGGVWMVELAPVADPHDIPATVLGALGLREARTIDRHELMPRTVIDQVVEAIGDRATLVVLDNCEHLIADAAVVADQLLAECPGLRILATSREPLGIDGEALTGLASLPMPPDGASAVDASSYQSVQLFADRALAADAGFTLDNRTAGPVCEIVRRLDGLPLAIELAAARLHVMPLAEIARRLEDRFALLTGGSRAALPRHQTLRAVVQWSWDLLTDHERMLVERLAVFAGGSTLESASAVVTDDALPVAGLQVLFDNLVDKSLLYVVEGENPRYRMLETIREYGVERLADRGEVAAARGAHASYFKRLALEAEPKLRTPDQLRWLPLLHAERDNITAALRFLGDSGRTGDALELVHALTWYWATTDNFAEAGTWLDYVLALPGEDPSELRTLLRSVSSLSALMTLSSASIEEVDTALALIRTAYEQLDAIPPSRYPIVALLRPLLAMFGGMQDQAETATEQGLTHEDPWVRAAVRMFRANMAENDGQLTKMREDVHLGVAEFRELGDRWGLAASLATLGQLLTLDGDVEGAIDAYVEATAYLDELSVMGEGNVIHLRLANLRLRQGDLEGARRQAERVRAMGRIESEVFADLVLFSVARDGGDDEERARLHQELVRHLAEFTPGHLVQDHLRAMLLAVLAEAELAAGNLPAAHTYATDGLAAGRRTQDMPIMASVGEAVARVAAADGHSRDAAVLLGAVATLRGAEDSTDQRYAAFKQSVMAVVGADFEKLFAAGAALGRDDAIARLEEVSSRAGHVRLL